MREPEKEGYGLQQNACPSLLIEVKAGERNKRGKGSRRSWWVVELAWGEEKGSTSTENKRGSIFDGVDRRSLEGKKKKRKWPKQGKGSRG